MECSCGGALVEGTSSYRISGDDYFLLLDNIPAYRCMRCDKVLFEDAVVEKIQRLVNRIERDSAEISTGTPSTRLSDY